MVAPPGTSAAAKRAAGAAEAAGADVAATCDHCGRSDPPKNAGVFRKLASRAINFVDRVTRNEIVFELHDGSLELRVNGLFAKSVTLLRVERSRAHIFDQDGWVMAVPQYQYHRLHEKLIAMASTVGVPCLTVSMCTPPSGVYSHEPASRPFTTLTFQMPAGSGILRLSWTRQSGELEESVPLWAPHRLATESAAMLPQNVFAASPSAKTALTAIATWAAERAGRIFVVVDAPSVEGQLLANELAPALPRPGSSFVVLVPASHQQREGGGVLLGGAIGGYSTALAIHALALATNTFDCPAAWVDAELWSRYGPTILRVLQAELSSSKHAHVCLRSGVLPLLQKFLEELRDAYSASRPYMHAIIGAGALESDVQEALQGAAEVVASRCAAIEAAKAAAAVAVDDELSAAAIAEACSVTAAGAPMTLQKLEKILEGHGNEARQTGGLDCPPESASPRKTLVPIGAKAQELAQQVTQKLPKLWQQGRSWDRNLQCLVVLDLADEACDTWLREGLRAATADAGGEPPSVHALLLLPPWGAPRQLWDAAARPLALLADGEVLDLGLGLLAPSPLKACSGEESDSALLVELLEALGAVSLHDVAFQLRPKPRAVASLAVVAWQESQGEDDGFSTLLGMAMDSSDVQASFTLWPASSMENGLPLLPSTLLAPGAAPVLARAGRLYESNVRAPLAGRVWHLCTHPKLEAAAYRTVVGDFHGRKLASFRLVGNQQGPRTRLFEVAQELAGDEDEAEEEQEAQPAAAAAAGGDEPGQGYSADEYNDESGASRKSRSRSRSRSSSSSRSRSRSSASA